jgi:hypothetical protein
MVKVKGALFSLWAWGRLGDVTYRRIGLIPNPYPIGLFKFRDGLLWEPRKWSDKKVRWRASNFTWRGLRKEIDPHFLSYYYCPTGWIYERRRTWHGLINIAKRAPFQPNPRTYTQVLQRSKFSEAYARWHTLTEEEKEIWDSYSKGKILPGYQLFIKYYLLDKVK